MDSFITIRIKRKTAKRFQKFSKTYFNSHSETMAAMLDFFLYNKISPKENLGPTGRRIEQTFKKRINAVIAIMRNIEKTQTKPTLAMLQSLFETEGVKDKALTLEKKVLEKTNRVRYQEKKDSGEL